MTDTWLRRFRRRHPRLLDAVLALGVLVVSGGTTLVDRLGNHVQPNPIALTLAVVSSAAVLAHRRHPYAVFAVTLGCGLAICFVAPQLSPGLIVPLLAALYFLAVHTDRNTARAATAVSAVLVTGATIINDPHASLGVKIGVISWVLLPGAFGDSVRNRRAHLAAIEERAERAERTREEEARRRVADERIRIARDLHDVVAHHIALANAQAGIAVHLLDRHPAQAREMLSHLTDATGSALRELKATVGLLRRADDPEAPLEPAPGLDRLPDLIGSFERAGLPVHLTVEGEPQPLSPGVDLTAFRILQESLTNVAKHAAGSTAEVTLTYSGSRVRLTVANGRSAAAPTVASASTSSASTGFGLIGMRERAAAVGGRLTADRRPGGGFLVSAELPLRTAAREEPA
ncbi:sensor histidine kinase [Kitasatospora sp. NPDC093806]|uniref:sensor histidine kinase n=1 Tax=Kitasatospora sp. NPDC093806 TaxID=3155075 RepID=UPI0034204BBE